MLANPQILNWPQIQNGSIALLELSEHENAPRVYVSLYKGAHPNEYYLDLPENSLLAERLLFNSQLELRFCVANKIYQALLSRHYAALGAGTQSFILSVVDFIEEIIETENINI